MQNTKTNIQKARKLIPKRLLKSFHKDSVYNSATSLVYKSLSATMAGEE